MIICDIIPLIELLQVFTESNIYLKLVMLWELFWNSVINF